MRYANYQEANRAFYRLTVLPMVGRVAQEFSAFLRPRFGEENANGSKMVPRKIA